MLDFFCWVIFDKINKIFNIKLYSYIMVDILSEIHISTSPIATLTSEVGFIPFLRAQTLLEIQKILIDNDLHWLVIRSSVWEEAVIRWFSSVVFDTQIRKVNTGIHIDTVDIPATKNMILTVLYSPHTSWSDIPTLTFDTGVVDRKARMFFEAHSETLAPYQAEIVRFKQQIIQVIWPEGGDDQLWVYTTLLNNFLAHKEINIQTSGALRNLRDDFVQMILDEKESRIGRVTTRKWESTLFVFRNGIGIDRGVAHARFEDIPQSVCVWPMINMGIGRDGSIAVQKAPQIIPDGVSVFVVGKVV